MKNWIQRIEQKLQVQKNKIANINFEKANILYSEK